MWEFMYYAIYSTFLSFQVTLKMNMMMSQSRWSLLLFRSLDFSILFVTLLYMLLWMRTSRKISSLQSAFVMSNTTHLLLSGMETQEWLWCSKKQVVFTESLLQRSLRGKLSVMAILKSNSVISQLQKGVWKGTLLCFPLNLLCTLH